MYFIDLVIELQIFWSASCVVCRKLLIFWLLCLPPPSTWKIELKDPEREKFVLHRNQHWIQLILFSPILWWYSSGACAVCKTKIPLGLGTTPISTAHEWSATVYMMMGVVLRVGVLPLVSTLKKNNNTVIKIHSQVVPNPWSNYLSRSQRSSFETKKNVVEAFEYYLFFQAQTTE